MALACAGCLQKIPNREYLICLLCNDTYDLECANVSIQRFLNTMTREHKQSWKCQICRSKKPKTDNTNTPIRPQLEPLPTKPSFSLKLNKDTIPKNKLQDNVNTRPRKPTTYENSASSSEDELSILGDTIPPENTTNSSPKKTAETPSNPTITIDQIEALLDRKLDTIKQSLLSELKSTIISVTTTEIFKLKNEMTQTTNSLKVEQIDIKQNITKMEKTIAQLDTENLKLRKEIQDIQKLLPLDSTKSQPTENNDKKIVLYGLIENEWENNYELHDRIINIFQDILNVNLSGYIEDLKRLGRKGYRRPLVIELLSKNMTRNILHNRRFFKNTGLAITELLGSESLQRRNKLVEILVEARRNGCRANIINNKLIIDGKEHKITQESPINIDRNQTDTSDVQTQNSTANNNNLRQTPSSSNVQKLQHSRDFFRK